MSEITKLLRVERVKQGLSLQDVANRTGIDKSNIAKIETDPKANPTILTILRIAEAISKTVELVDKG